MEYEQRPIENKLIDKELNEMIQNDKKEDIDYLLEKINNNNNNNFFPKSKLLRMNTKNVKDQNLNDNNTNNNEDVSDTIIKSNTLEGNKMKDLILESKKGF